MDKVKTGNDGVGVLPNTHTEALHKLRLAGSLRIHTLQLLALRSPRYKQACKRAKVAYNVTSTMVTEREEAASASKCPSDVQGPVKVVAHYTYQPTEERLAVL